MAYIFNATNEKQSVKAQGNWFEFKPKQIKFFNTNVADFLAQERAENGLVSVSDAFEDPGHKATPEGKAELEAAEIKGIDNYIKFHRAIIANNQISLRQDLEKANLKMDPAVLASDGELRSMEIVAKYQTTQDDRDQKKVDRVKELMTSVGKVSR